MTLVLTVSGCATTTYSFHLRKHGVENGHKLVWPQQPDVPRFMYLGEITGENNYDKSAAGSLDKFIDAVVGFVAGESAPDMLQRPQSGVTDENGDTYVTDVSRQAVYVFSQSQNLRIWNMAGKHQKFLAPIAVALGKGGELLVTDAELGIVARLSPDGAPLGVIGKGDLKRPTGIARDSDNGLIFVADTYDHNIKVFDDNGDLVRVIGHRGAEKGTLNYPIHLACAKGKIYVTDTLNARVQVFDEEGNFLFTFGKRGLYKGEFTRPKGIAVDSDGNIYVIESFYDYLLVYNNKGVFLMPLGGSGSEPGKFYLPAGVWVDNKDRVFVADMFNRRVVVFQYLGGS